MKVVIEFYVVVSVITILSSVFAYVYIMGGGRGGPGTSTMVVELYIFNALIRTSLPGIASAVSVHAVPGVAAADRAAVRGAPARQRGGGGRRRSRGRSPCSRDRRAASTPSCWSPPFRPGADRSSCADLAEEPGGIHLQQGRPAAGRWCSTTSRTVLFDSPFFAWMGNSIDPRRRRGAAEHRRSPASAPTPSPGCSSRAGCSCSRSARR